MNHKTYLCLCLSVILSLVESWGQPLISFTSDEGLSNTRIRSITEDSRRNVWISTSGGLNRYDGAKMNVYRHEPGVDGTLGHDIVTYVLEWTPGRVLVGLENGVQLYDYDTDSFTRIPLLAANGDTVPAHIISMAKLSSGDVYACTAGFGIYQLKASEGDTVFSETTDLWRQSSLLQIFEDGKGRLWLLGVDGSVYCGTGGKFVVKGRWAGTVKLCSSSSGTIYLGTVRDGLLRYSEEEGVFRCVSPESRRFVMASINAASGGRILVSTDGDGLQVFDEQTGALTQSSIRTYEYNLATSNVKDAIVDSAGNTWVGVYWKGVVVSPEVASDFAYVGRRSVLRNTLGTNCVTCITGDGAGNLWVATDHCGMYHLQADGSSSVHFKPGIVKTMPSTVMSILVDSRGDIWLGSTWGGVVKMNPVTGECVNIGRWAAGGERIPNAYALVEDRFGRLWIGTNGDGIYSFDLTTHRLQHYGPLVDNTMKPPYQIVSNPWIMSFLLRGDSLYASTSDGIELFRITPAGIESVVRFAHRHSVRDIACDAEGHVWAASALGLISTDAVGGNLRLYTVADGLPANSVNSVEVPGDGRVWVGTDDGLSCHIPATGEFTNFRIEDGVQGNEFGTAASYAAGGVCYFGGVNGLTFFHSSAVGKEDKVDKLDLRLVDLYVGGRLVHVGDRSGRYEIIRRWFPEETQVELSHDDRTFSFDVSAMGFNRSRVTYYYSINDGEWIALERGQRRVSFVNMETGTHHIRVKAQGYGVESDVKSLAVTIHPVWYLSAGAKVFYVLFLLLGCFVAFHQVREHFRSKRLLEKHRRAEELNEMRIQFFMNISHEIRTPMTLILSPLMKLMRADADEERQRTYSLIYQNSQRILRLINQLMDARKIEKGQFSLKYHKVEMVGFINNLYDLFSQSARNRDIHFGFVHDMPELIVCLDPQNFDKVVMNLLSNAFKFTPDGGTITIELRDVPDTSGDGRDFVLSVTDSGVGIPGPEKERVFERFYSGKNEDGYVGTGIGLNLTKLLVELHNGQVSVEDNPSGQGTRFVVRMPRALKLLNEITEDALPWASYTAPLEAGRVVETVDEQPDMQKASRGGNVVLVEDEVTIRRYLHGELSDRYRVTEFGNGAEAYDYIIRHLKRVDLVVSDVMMPVMDGLELCRKLKENFHTAHLPVVLLTAKGDDADRLDGLEKGADAYMSKPFNIDILRQTLENLLKSRTMIVGQQEVEQYGETMEAGEVASPDRKLMDRVLKTVQDNLNDPDLNVGQLAEIAGVSRVHFYRKLKEATGLTPREFIRNLRLVQAAKILSERESCDISELAETVGFRSLSMFCTSFKSYYGVTPREYMKRANAEKAAQELSATPAGKDDETPS